MKRLLLAAYALAFFWSPASFAQQDPDHCVSLQATAECLTGFDEHGGRYIFVVPYSWNGELVIYSKPSGGLVSGPYANFQFLTFRNDLVQEGYAVGYLDQPDRDYKTDSQQANRLPQRFALQARKPSAVYLVGESRGGVLSLDLAETYPEQYAGALVQCAPALGFTDSSNRRLDVRVLFDYFFTLDRVAAWGIPRILKTPLDSTSLTYSPLLYGLIASDDPQQIKLGEIASVMRYPTYPDSMRAGSYAYSEVSTDSCIGKSSALPDSIVRRILFLMTQDRAILAQTPVKSPYDNMNTVYAGSQDDAALNAGVQRFQGNPSAVNHQAKYYTPTGDLRIPVLLLYNRFDPLDTLNPNLGYVELVKSAGNTSHLASWSVGRFSHCWFTRQERLDAFRALVAWVKGGAKPDDLEQLSGSGPDCPR